MIFVSRSSRGSAGRLSDSFILRGGAEFSGRRRPRVARAPTHSRARAPTREYGVPGEARASAYSRHRSRSSGVARESPSRIASASARGSVPRASRGSSGSSSSGVAPTGVPTTGVPEASASDRAPARIPHRRRSAARTDRPLCARVGAPRRAHGPMRSTRPTSPSRRAAPRIGARSRAGDGDPQARESSSFMVALDQALETHARDESSRR